MSEYTVEQVLNIAEKLSDVLETKTGVVNGAVVRKMLLEYADTLSKPADSGRVVDGVMTALAVIYGSGYRHGHEATVEGGYTDVVHYDRETYWLDTVREMVDEDADLAAALAAQGQGKATAWLVTRDHDRTFPHVYISESSADAVVEWVTLPPFANKVPLYTAPPASPAGVPDVVSEVMAELEKAIRKFPTWPTDPLHAVGVFNEEAGELSKAVLQQVYEPHKNAADDVRKEARQAAAMALRFLVSVDSYDWTPGTQHEQPSLAAPSAPEGGHIDRARFEKALAICAATTAPGTTSREHIRAQPSTTPPSPKESEMAEKMDSERAPFESWVQTTSGWKACKQRGKPMHLRQNADGSYNDFRVNDRWCAWKARAHLAQPAQAVDVDALYGVIRNFGYTTRSQSDELAEAISQLITHAIGNASTTK